MGKDNKRTPSAIVIIFVLTAIVLVGFIYYSKYVIRQYDNKSENTLVAEQDGIKKVLNEFVDSEFTSLNLIAEMTSAYEDYSNISINEFQRNIEEKNLEHVGISDLKGNAYMMDGTNYNISVEDFFKDTLLYGENVTLAESFIDNKKICIFSTCIYKEDKCVGIVFVLKNPNEFDKIFKDLNYEIGKNTIVIDSNGYIISGNLLNELKYSGNNILNATNIKNDDLQVLYSNIKNNYGKTLKITIEGTLYGIRSQKLGICDWRIVSAVNLNGEEKEDMLFNTYAMFGSMLILYMLAIILIMFIESKNKKDMEKIIYSDEVSGGISYEKFLIDANKTILSNSDDYAVVDFDIDGFKFINDIFGYEEGNNVIRKIWKEINEEITGGEVFAHRSADEFVGIFKYKDNKMLLSRIEKINDNIVKNNEGNSKNYELKLSVGIYYVDRKNFQLNHAIDWAVLAKKSIKGKRNMLYATFDERIREKVLRKGYIESMMKKAIEKEEFKVYYQPKFDTSTGKLAGAEALVRWYSQVEGVIFPSEFIPVFEENGFITELDKYMFEHVCNDIKKWLNEGFDVVPVSVNISQLQMFNTRFIDEYEMIILDKKIPPEYVQLELTETTLFSNGRKLNEIMDHLHSIGFKILMDDFGTGYSSLNMLKNAKVDILKLDKSFVDDIGEKKGDIVVSTIVSLGQSLNMKIVAEGVESKEQYEFLRDIECDEIQGYYFSKPVPREEYEEMLKKGAL